jgi:opacity protein-like surface antigen
MNRVLVHAFAIAAVLLLNSAAEAQDRWGAELRASGAVPTRDIGPDRLQTGVSMEGTIRYRFLPHLAVYAGWGWTHFGSDQTFAGSDMDFEETGYALGLQFEHPLLRSTTTAGWIRAGATIDHIEIEDDEGHLVGDSEHGLGWEAGAGIAYYFAPKWALTPGVRYRALSRDIDINGVETAMDLEYVVFEIGIRRSF